MGTKYKHHFVYVMSCLIMISEGHLCKKSPQKSSALLLLEGYSDFYTGYLLI